MKPNPYNTPHMDDACFDRLVDGELSEAQRRDLLARLDNERGGWRRCALAFLEAQCWKQAFSVAVPEDVPAAEQTMEIQPRRSSWPGRLGTLLAMAASFLVMLWLGSWAQRAWIGQPAAPAGMGAAIADGQQSDDGPWRVVTVSLPSSGEEPNPAINLSAVERNSVDKQWLRNVPSAIPENVLQALNRTGHQIQQRRKLVPVPLKDGRRLVVPVDQIEVHYVGTGVYY